MGHKCFISFKTEDESYKREIQKKLGIQNIIDKSLNAPIKSDDEDYIMREIREKHLKDSTVTIYLIGCHSAENSSEDPIYIKRELQASLYNGENNTRNGILGIVLPKMQNSIFKGPYICCQCGREHNWVAINDNTVVKEFSSNYYIQKGHEGCCWHEDERYCTLCSYEKFIKNPTKYIDEAFDKRTAPIAKKVTVYPK